MTLLDKGSTQLIRNTAATQLADIQKQNPDSLFPLLSRVLPFLQSKSWDTRTAAAKAIGGIVANSPAFEPNEEDADTKSEIKNENGVKKEDTDSSSSTSQLLQLDSLDIGLILQYGKMLLGSAGKEYEYSLAGLSAAERLVHQKKSLRARLGLGGGYGGDDILSENDLPANSQHKDRTSGLTRVDTQFKARQESTFSPQTPNSAVPETPLDESGLSKRQLNQLKRKNKTMAKAGPNKMRVVDLGARKPSGASSPVASSSPHPIKLNGHEASQDESQSQPDYFSIKQEGGDDETQLVKEFKGEPTEEKPWIAPEHEDANEWPFELMCDYLSVDIFDPNWEIRHGAAMGLREVLLVHGQGAGRKYGRTKAENDNANRQWLDDLACRLLCVMMLDRFGDYVSDTVIAPIRESIGQTLGALITQLPDQTALSVYANLQKMIYQTDTGMKAPVWEVCHGGMLGLRYFVAVRKDLLFKHGDLMDGTINAVIRGLGHTDDDVKSVSAATLVPIAQELTKMRPHALGGLISVVWDCLVDMQDDLSASTGAIMDLLANLCSFPEVLQAMRQNATKDSDQSFTVLVPRLYSFLRHTITSVRFSVLKALTRFLDVASQGETDWIDGRLVRLLFQNILVERNEGVLKQSFAAFHGLVEFLKTHSTANRAISMTRTIEYMIRANCQPIGQSRYPLPMDATLFIKPSGAPMAATAPAKGRQSSEPPNKKRKREESQEQPNNTTHNTDGHVMSGDIDIVGMDTMIRTRIYGARALGELIALQDASSVQKHFELIMSMASAKHASTRLFAAMSLEETAKNLTGVQFDYAPLAAQLQTLLDESDDLWYSDIVTSLQAARGQCQTLLAAFATHAHVPRTRLPSLAAVCQGEDGSGPTAFGLADAEKIVTSEFDRIMKLLTPAQRVTGTQYLNDARSTAATTVADARKIKEDRDLYVKAAFGAVLVALREVPKKPGQLIKCIMDSIKTEENVELQQRSAATVASLIEYYVNSPKRGPTDKLVSNLCKFTCVDTSETPEFGPNSSLEDVVLSLRKEEDRKDHPDAAKFEREAKEARTMRRGARHALRVLADLYGDELFIKIPVLLVVVEEPMRLLEGSEATVDQLKQEDTGQNVVDAFSTLRTIAPYLHPSLQEWLEKMMPLMKLGIRHQLSVIRYAAAKCFATVCSVIPGKGMTMLVEHILPNMGNALDLRDRQGITETVYHLIHAMGDQVLPYVIFLIVPVLGRMSDSNDEVRLLATTSFATLVKLVPLEAGIPDPPGMSEELLQGRERERKFMAQMLDPKKAEPFQIPVAIKAELRSYQQDGVNWLAFLGRYNLHGVLCDDMGLGKTLQTLCIVASDHHLRAEEYEKTGAPDKRRIPSLIVCPPTLSGHWQQEIKQYAPFLSCVAYVGPPGERAARRPQLSAADIVITSYDVCRNDTDVLAPMTWNYCVLDEGHLIKNPKAKITICVKKLMSNHRLILSGTPIQNNVLELWSLFDFLMPGFLGTEKVFQDRFAKPIAQSRNAKSSSKEQEAGALAVEALHKQVLPFLLRRLKEEVLNDLPPKILQNYYCDLSDLQKKLFDDFFKKEKKTVEASLGAGDKDSKQHIFQALQYMRKLCNSPAMVMKEGHAQYEAYRKQLAAGGSSLRDVAHAPKLGALRDLLVDCGIGVPPDSNDISGSSGAVSQHRALIFCQMKEMLDMVQNEVLGKLLPDAQFLRLDGSVEATKRQDIVNKFNNDPSYDCLLLTTSVGGLGLNLTGADTVIFVEHDWNPQKDIQAMDRAHRLGQKKTVNVYRLITRGTLEEKIMGLQRFKIDVASTVVNQQNAGLGTMETDQILDLFSLGEGVEGGGVPGLDSAAGTSNGADMNGREEDMVDEQGNVKKKGDKGFLDDIGELWDERQYEEEFNLDSFLQKMQK
ncbi:TATA-binding protein-associated factor mot1 [Exophiala xenobiotica]|uniref:TATA-binding protein-associated factor mot1 n=1 Tax=Lithohypha guttulata TaxID=1690604 RepID=A0ABR0KG05_9EURO|nr:TATA-binding protein-associated factor mot1 [Lithohypha guttulata]KAK5322976.1 TATA-binding protein-associated factor mot1 [Exophiala xenobiotica]